MAYDWRRKMSHLLLLTAACIPLLVANDATAQEVDPMLVAEGAAMYGATCARCHYARSPLERSDRQWVVIMTHMRVRANLTGGQARKVLAFLMATNGQPSPGQAASTARDEEGDRTAAGEGQLERHAAERSSPRSRGTTSPR
jgi:mono/diheme cytochrome c family protein